MCTQIFISFDNSLIFSNLKMNCSTPHFSLKVHGSQIRKLWNWHVVEIGALYQSFMGGEEILPRVLLTLISLFILSKYDSAQSPQYKGTWTDKLNQDRAVLISRNITRNAVL